MSDELLNRKGNTVKDADFWLELQDNCSLTIEKAKKLAPEILKAYRDDIKLINVSLLKENNNNQVPSNYDTSPNLRTPSNLIDIGYGDYKVHLPKDQKEQQQVWRLDC